MTGITRVSKESIFSDLNNPEVVTTTSDKYATSFGFTEEEVFAALDECGLSGQKEKVKQWYDGFTFGKHKDIYNPWSILNFLDKKTFMTYWANTSSNSLIGKLLREGTRRVKESFERLLKYCNWKNRQVTWGSYLEIGVLVCMMMTGAVAASLLGGCGSSTASTTETAVTDDAASTQAPQTDVEDEKESKGTDSPAQQTPASDFKTKVKDDGTIEIELYRGEASEVVIPDTIDGKEVSVVGGFGNHDEITSVVIPDTLTEIGEGAFSGVKLTELNLPESLNIMGGRLLELTLKR